MGFLRAALNLVILTVLFTFIQSQEYIRTKRRMYAMCPPKFQRIGTECYAISDQPANWLEAHFQCKDKNSKLAEPNNKSDRKLRAFFQRMDHDTDDIWIGATYDWNINIWQWSISGKNLTYDAFSRLDPKSSQSLEYHCAVLNPSLKYRWSARPCVDKHRYICQHKMPRVSKKNRFKVYNRWNQTYPNQLANEVEMEVIDTKTKDGKRTARRLKPIDSSENYPMPPRRSTESTQTNNDIHVKFIPNYLTNEINGDVSYRTPSPAKDNALTMEFIPAVIDVDNNNVQAAQAIMETTTKRPRNPTNAPSRDNETVNPMKPRTNHRVKTKFDELNEEKRRLDRNQKRRRRKQERIRLQKEKKLEEERKKREEERKKLEDERKRQEEEQKLNEEERKKSEQVVIEQLKLKQAEEKKQEEADLLERQKLEALLKKSKQEQELQEAEAKILKEKREEEEEHIRKQRLHEQNRLKLEYEERLKQQQTERERRVEEEKRKADENRRRIEQEEAARQEELKRLQEEDEKRLELQRMEIERKRQEKELARLEEENQKRIAAQKVREEEIRRREEALAAQLDEEKRLLEELRTQQEKDRLIHEQEIQNDIDEKKKQEEAERQEIERKEALQKQKEERFRKKLEEQKQLQEAAKLEEEKKIKREKLRKYAERISRLPPDMQAKFFQLRKERHRNNRNNEASIPERK